MRTRDGVCKRCAGSGVVPDSGPDGVGPCPDCWRPPGTREPDCCDVCVLCKGPRHDCAAVCVGCRVAEAVAAEREACVMDVAFIMGSSSFIQAEALCKAIVSQIRKRGGANAADR